MHFESKPFRLPKDSTNRVRFAAKQVGVSILTRRTEDEALIRLDNREYAQPIFEITIVGTADQKAQVMDAYNAIEFRRQGKRK